MQKSFLIIALCLIGLALITSSVFAYGLGDSASLIQTTAGQTGLEQQNISAITAGIIKAILGLLGAIFITLIIYGGITWMIAGGNDQQVDSAKKVLTSAVLGLVLVMGAYSITFFIATAIERAGPIATPGETTDGGFPDSGDTFGNQEASCSTIPNGSCKTYDACTRKKCLGGRKSGSPCSTSSDCPSGTCPPSGSVIPGSCKEGQNAGASCTTTVDCPGGSCGNLGCGNLICCQSAPATTIDSCDSCGAGLNFCDATECNSLGNCVFYNSKCITKGDCDKCGEGITNLCDRAECLSIGGDCKFDSKHKPKCY